MKMSVYVPDELWEEMKKVAPDVKASALIQDAIRARVTSHVVRPYAVLRDEAEEARKNASAQILGQQSDAYTAGYRVGIEFARRLPWEAFVDLSHSDWVVKDWAHWMDGSEYRVPVKTDGWEEADYLAFDDLLETAIEEADVDVWNMTIGNGWATLGVPGEGFRDAIRDAWTGTFEPPTAPASLGAETSFESESGGST